MVVAGFATTVIAALVDLVNIYASGTYRFLVFSGMVGIYLSPLIALSTTAAWWFLVQVSPESATQRGLLRRITWLFAADMALAAAASISYGWPQSPLSWTGSIVWLQALGEAVAALGLVEMTRARHDIDHVAPLTPPASVGVVDRPAP